MEPSIQGSN